MKKLLKNTVVSVSIILFMLVGICVSLIYHFSGSQEETSNTEFANEATHERDFVDELAYRENLVINIAETWASEELGLSTENLSFESVVDGGTWRVNLIDNSQNITSSIHVDYSTGEVDEIITMTALESLIKVNGMSIVLADYTWISAELQPHTNHEILETNLELEDAGVIIAEIIYEEFNIEDVDGSRFEMFFRHDSNSDSQTWNADVYLNPNIDTIGSPHILPDFHIIIDAITGIILHLTEF